MHEDYLTISVLCPLQVSCITEVVLMRLITYFFYVFPMFVWSFRFTAALASCLLLVSCTR